MIRFYQKWISPLKGHPTCRFYPTCSAYAYEAIEKYGVIKGMYLAIRRILKYYPGRYQFVDPETLCLSFELDL